MLALRSGQCNDMDQPGDKAQSSSFVMQVNFASLPNVVLNSSSLVIDVRKIILDFYLGLSHLQQLDLSQPHGTCK